MTIGNEGIWLYKMRYGYKKCGMAIGNQYDKDTEEELMKYDKDAGEE